LDENSQKGELDPVEPAKPAETYIGFVIPHCLRISIGPRPRLNDKFRSFNYIFKAQGHYVTRMNGARPNGAIMKVARPNVAHPNVIFCPWLG
jgi:hypothetical protein